MIKIELGFKERSEVSQRAGRLLKQLSKGDLTPAALRMMLEDEDERADREMGA